MRSMAAKIHIVLRAAELFFRTQRMTLHEGSLIAADEETIAGTSGTPTSPLVSMLGLPAEAEIDIINDDNAEHYFEHSDLFHMAIDLTAGRRGLKHSPKRCGAGSRIWLGVEVAVEPLTELRDATLPGMSVLMPTPRGSATRSGTARSSTRRRRAQVVGIFRLTFRDPMSRWRRLSGEPVYLILAMTHR